MARAVPLPRGPRLEVREFVGPIDATSFTHNATVSGGAGPAPLLNRPPSESRHALPGGNSVVVTLGGGCRVFGRRVL